VDDLAVRFFSQGAVVVAIGSESGNGCHHGKDGCRLRMGGGQAVLVSIV